jgi:diguanylate cyclase (GGDEF)-like protein
MAHASIASHRQALREMIVLVVLEESTSLRRVFGAGRVPSSPFIAARWGRIGAPGTGAGQVEAVVYQDDHRRDVLAARLERLRKLFPDALFIPFRVGGPRSGRRRAIPGPEPILRAPLNPALVLAVLEREREVAGIRHRARRRLGKCRDLDAKLRALTAIVRATGKELDPHRIIDLAMEQISRFLNIRAWLFLLADADQGFLIVERSGGEGMASMKGIRIGIGEGIAGRAGQKRQPVLIDDVGIDGSTFGAPELPRTLTARSILAVPLLSRGKLIGVVEAVDTLNGARFRSGEARLLALLMEPAAVAVDNAMLLRRSEELSITDDLTKLYNSRFLNATLRREVERSKRYRTPVSLIFMDLDGFKSVNDQHGHLFGSRALIEVGSVLRTTVREIDIVSRFGGDEFTVILPQTGPEGAQIIADRIRQKIEETIFLESYGVQVRLTASIGIASFPDHGRTKDDLIARADSAMYAVKGRGKNGVALSDPDGPRPLQVQTVR